MLGITLRWTSIQSREARETGINSGLMGQFGQTSLWLPAGHISFANTPILYCNLVGRKYFFFQMAREFAPFIRAKRQFHWLSITKLVHYMFFHFVKYPFVIVNCPPGTHSDNDTNTCVDCNIGFYIDEEGKTECQPCPKNYSTAITGATNKTDCRRKKSIIIIIIIIINIILFYTVIHLYVFPVLQIYVTYKHVPM